MPHEFTPLPRPTIATLAPPDEAFPYFQRGEHHPFVPRSSDFQIVNAAWLADASFLAYGQESLIRKKIDEAGPATAGMEVKRFEKANAQCYVMHNGDFAVVAFRGTRVDRFPDAISLLGDRLGKDGPDAPVPEGSVVFSNWADLMTTGDASIDLDTNVHAGFLQAFNRVWPDVESHLLQECPNLPIWFTGHSLGAALATLACTRFTENVQPLYTFGSPRVGNTNFTAMFPVRCFRFVHGDDIVARLPPPGPPEKYHHVPADVKFITNDGAIVTNPSLADEIGASISGAMDRLQDSLAELNPIQIGERLLSLGASLSDFDLFHPDLDKAIQTILRLELVQQIRSLQVEVPVSGLADHAPVYYSLNLWNQVE